jgi:prephenate dehydrogenase
MNVSIIGGSGRLGLWYAEKLKAAGATITITGRNRAKLELAARSVNVDCTVDNEHAIRAANIIVVSVPIAVAPAAIEQAARLAEPGTLVCDLSSVKSTVLAIYRGIRRDDIELASLHPLHGPRVSNLKNVTILGIFLREGRVSDWLRRAFELMGANVIRIDAAEHDKAMAVLQGLTHFVAICAAKAIEQLGRPCFETPAYTLLRAAMARVLLQDAALYAAIQVANPENAAVRGAFLRAASQLDALSNSGDVQGIQRMIEAGAGLFQHPESELAHTDACLPLLLRR